MKFNGGVLGKVLGAILCILLGMIIAIGGEVGAIYYILTASKVGDLADRLEPNLPEGVELTFDEETREMTVLEWGQELLGFAGNGDTATIGQLEGLVGYALISNTLYDMIGVDAATVKQSTFSNLGTTISDSLTLSIISDKFGIELPDMPLFQKDEFMEQKLTDAFKDLTTYPLSDFVKITEESNAIIKSISDLTIDDLGTEKLTEKINALRLDEIVEISDGTDGKEKSNAVLIALKDLTVGDLAGEKGNDAVNSLFISEIMTVNEDSEKIIQALKYSSLESKIVEIPAADLASGVYLESAEYFTENPEAENREVPGYEYVYKAEDGTAYVFVIEDGVRKYDEVKGVYFAYETKESTEEGVTKQRPIIGINDTVGTLTMGEILEIDPDDKLMNSLSGSTLHTIADDINRLFMDEIMTIDENSSRTIVALKYTALKTSEKELTASELDDGYDLPADEKVEGYVYYYDLERVPYVARMTNTGERKMNEDRYVLVETKLYDGKYRPLVSLDESINSLFIGELLEITPDSTATLKALENASLESKTSTIAPGLLTDPTPATAPYELDGYTYKYHAEFGLAYVCVTDEDGDPKHVTAGGDPSYDPSDDYVLYDTRFVNGKYRPLMGVDERIDRLTLGEVMTIDENSPTILVNLQDTRVNAMGDAIDGMFLDEMMTIKETADIEGPASAPVLIAIRFNTLEGVKSFVNKAAADADTAELLASPAYATEYAPYEQEGYEYVYRKNAKGTKYIPYAKIDETTIESVPHYRVYETKLYKGFFRPKVELDAKLNDLSMRDVFTADDLETGVLSMVSPDTKINDLGDAVSDQIKISTLAKLNAMGILEVEKNGNMNDTAYEVRAFIWNNTVTDMLDGMLKFVGNPALHAGEVVPTKKAVGGAYASLTAFTAAYEQYETLELTGNVTVTVDPATDGAFKHTLDNGLGGTEDVYVVPTFNVDGKVGNYTVSFVGGENVQLGVYRYEAGVIVEEDGEYALGQTYFYAYDISGTYDSVEGAYDGSGLYYYDGTVYGATASSVAGKQFKEYKKTTD